MARCPSLDDYDRNNHRLEWAEGVAAAVHAPYDEEFQAEIVPIRSRGELRADAVAQAATAAERYAAHRERARVLEEAARAAKEVARKRQAELEAERRLTWAAHAELQKREREEAERRRQQWLAEQAAWARQEREEAQRRYQQQWLAEEAERAHRRANAKTMPQWGEGCFIIMHETTPVRWNGHPEGQPVDMIVGDVWNVGPYLADRLKHLRRATDA